MYTFVFAITDVKLYIYMYMFCFMSCIMYTY